MFLWIVIVGAGCAVFCAFGIGANDVANAFGSSVGARAITLKQAICIAAVCEFSGAVLLGGGVSDTIRKGIANVDAFADIPYVRGCQRIEWSSEVAHHDTCPPTHRCSCLACCASSLRRACGCCLRLISSSPCLQPTARSVGSLVRSGGAVCVHMRRTCRGCWLMMLGCLNR